MRAQKKMLMAAVLAASLVGMSTGPVMADEDGKDEGATVLQSELPPSERSLLERAGVRGAEVNIQPLGEYTHLFPMGRTGQSQRAGVAAPHLR